MLQPRVVEREGDGLMPDKRVRKTGEQIKGKENG